MSISVRTFAAAALLAAGAASFVGTAAALPLASGLALKNAAPATVETVHRRRLAGRRALRTPLLWPRLLRPRPLLLRTRSLCWSCGSRPGCGRLLLVALPVLRSGQRHLPGLRRPASSLPLSSTSFAERPTRGRPRAAPSLSGVARP